MNREDLIEKVASILEKIAKHDGELRGMQHVSWGNKDDSSVKGHVKEYLARIPADIIGGVGGGLAGGVGGGLLGGLVGRGAGAALGAGAGAGLGALIGAIRSDYRSMQGSQIKRGEKPMEGLEEYAIRGLGNAAGSMVAPGFGGGAADYLIAKRIYGRHKDNSKK